MIENLEGEIWKPIAGYEGLYEISNFGRVKSLKRVVIRKNGRPLNVLEKIKKIRVNKLGYLTVSLCKDNYTTCELLHRIVAIAFIYNPHNKPEVNHINFDKTNASIENLEWVTKYENKRHYSESKKCKDAIIKSRKINPQIALEIREFSKVMSQKELRAKFSLSPANISMIISNKIWADANMEGDFNHCKKERVYQGIELLNQLKEK